MPNPPKVGDIVESTLIPGLSGTVLSERYGNDGRRILEIRSDDVGPFFIHEDLSTIVKEGNHPPPSKKTTWEPRGQTGSVSPWVSIG